MTTTTVKPSLPIISNAQEETILTALRMLYGAVASYGASLPSFDQAISTSEERERIFARSLKALNSLHAHRKEQEVAAFRQGAKDVIAPYIQEHKQAKQEFDSLSEALRSKLPAFPETVNVPVDDFSHIFPENTPKERMVAILKMLTYTVGQKDKSYFVKVQVPFTTKAA